MNFIKNNKAVFISIIALILMLLFVLGWNYIIKKQNKTEIPTTNDYIDVSNVNNVPNVEAKFGSDIKITQGYLLTYTRNKSKTWYKSQGYVKNIKTNNTTTTIYLSKDKNSNQTLTTTIDNEKWEYKKGDTLYFVGTLDLSSSSISLSRISKDDIGYQNVTEIELEELMDNISSVKANYFIINGYMVTDGNKYKLFDSKDSYNKDSSAGTYFTINWQEKFNFTGNGNVTIKCLIEDTYKLHSCELQNK